MQRATLTSYPDVLDAKDVASILSVSYISALRVIRYGGINYVRIGRAYRISKQNFIDWLNCTKPTTIKLD